MRKMKKWKQILCISMAGMLLLAGCAHQQKGTASPKKETIRIWVWDETFNVKAAKMAAEEYQKNHKDVNIVVEIREREEILADIKNLLAAKAYDKLPDIIMLEDYDSQDMLASYTDEFLDMTDRLDYSKYVDYKTKLCSWDGRMYGIPFDSGTTALFYRADILKQAGYTEADMQNLTWKRFIEIGGDVYKKTGHAMLTLDPTDLPLVRIIMQSCGEWYVDADGSRVNIEDNKALKEALGVYEQLLATNAGKSVSGWNEFISGFQSGEVASVISGAWIISSIKANEAQSGEWRIAPIPVVAENGKCVPASNVGGSSWYVLKHAGNSEAASQFLISMFGENNSFWSKLISAIDVVPCVKNPTDYSNYNTEDPFFGGQKPTKILTQMANKIPTVNYGCNTYEIEKILAEEFQNILVTNEMDTSLKKVQMRAAAVTRR